MSDAQSVRKYLARRSIAAFSIDVDSSDWRTKSPIIPSPTCATGFEKSGGGIILFHDIHEQTARALPRVLKELKEHNFKVVQLVPKAPIESIVIGEPAIEEAHRAAMHSRRYAHSHHKRESSHLTGAKRSCLQGDRRLLAELGTQQGTVTVKQWLGTHGPCSVCVWTSSEPPPPLSEHRHPAGHLALFPLRSELPRRRGHARRARCRRVLRDGPPLGFEVRRSLHAS